MVKQLGVSIDDWLWDEIEKRRGEMNRSEYVSQQLVKSFGIPLEVANDAD